MLISNLRVLTIALKLSISKDDIWEVRNWDSEQELLKFIREDDYIKEDKKPEGDRLQGENAISGILLLTEFV
jgi:hypothetical protein